MDSRINPSYHRRLFGLLLSFIWIIVLCFVVFQFYREKQFKVQSLNSHLQMLNDQLFHQIGEGVPYDQCDVFGGKMDDDLRITIVNMDGVVLYDNKYTSQNLDNHITRPEVVMALSSGRGFHIGRKSASDGQQYFYSATLSDSLIVRTALPYSTPLKYILKTDWTFLWIMIGVSLLMSIVGYFVTRQLGKAITRLNIFRENEVAMKKEQEKAKIKRQLTNNINHELKTPVASMQVCLETLLSGISLTEEKRRDLLERCYMHNERLRRLLEDISLITRMEEGGSYIEREPVVINDILKEIYEEFSTLSEDGKFDLQIDFPEHVEISASQSLIISIFRNLMSNAVSYSEGSIIHIALLENNSTHCKILFEDNGKGVDEKSLPRLFERFYRVDKGRSRQKGGTGLGLAIVKHAVQIHGGTISVSNRPEGGLRFVFTLKRQ